MRVTLTGVSHKTAPVEIREKLRDVLAEAGDRDGAIGEMVSLAAIYLDRGEQHKAEAELYQVLDAEPGHPLFGQTVVFTGELAMARPEAKQRAAEMGARPESRVTGRTTVLVVGDGFAALVGRANNAASLNAAARPQIAEGLRPMITPRLCGAGGTAAIPAAGAAVVTD